MWKEDTGLSTVQGGTLVKSPGLRLVVEKLVRQSVKADDEFSGSEVEEDP